MLRLTPALLALCLVHPALAQDAPGAEGAIVDQTVTRIGHDFHRYLSERLRKAGELDFDLVVHEQPAAQWGSLVWVAHGEQVIYRRFLQPRGPFIGDVAAVAADMVLEAVNRTRLQSLLQDSFAPLQRGEL